MIGKRVLVGKSYEVGGEVVSREQFHGPIEATDERHGFGVRRTDTGVLEWLPPDLRAFHPADPGQYTLSRTGEVIEDPDYVSIWTVKRDPDAERGD